MISYEQVMQSSVFVYTHTILTLIIIKLIVSSLIGHRVTKFVVSVTYCALAWFMCVVIKTVTFPVN